MVNHSISRYFFADSNLVDNILYGAHVPAVQREELHSFLGRQGLLDAGAKFTCKDPDQFIRAKAVFERFGSRMFPGGSAANVAVTLKRLLGDAVKVDFFSSIDSTIYQEMLSAPFIQAGINLIEAKETAAYEHRFRQGESLIFVPEKNPDRSIMKSPTNTAHAVLASAELPPEVRQGSTVFFQLSAMDKFGRSFGERMLNANPEAGLVLGLSTKKSLSAEERDMAQHLVMKRVSIASSNAKELSTAFDGLPAEDAVKKIHAEWRSQQGQILSSNQNRFLFVTNGDDAAYVVSSALPEPKAVKPRKVKAVNTLGAGDTFLAGVMAGIELRLSPEEAGHIGVLESADKVQNRNGARVDDPLGVIITAADGGDEIARKFMERRALFAQSPASPGLTG